MGLETAIAGGIYANKAAETQSDAAKYASQLQSAAADKATAEQARQFDLARGDLAPYRDTGYAALNRLNAASSGDLSSFHTSPDYSFVRSEGQRDIGNSFAAQGGAASGNALRALSQYNQNLASGQYNNWWNQQVGLAGAGQGAINSGNAAGTAAANATTGIQQNAANQMGYNALYGANARATGIQQTNQAFQNSASNSANIFGYFFGGK